MGFRYNWDSDDCSVKIDTINWSPEMSATINVGALMKRVNELKSKDDITEEEDDELNILEQYVDIEEVDDGN